MLLLRRSKLPNPTGRNQYLIYDNHKVIIFHLLNYISSLIEKLHGKMKQKFALLFILHDCITYGINMTLLWRMGAVKSKCQFSCS